MTVVKFDESNAEIQRRRQGCRPLVSVLCTTYNQDNYIQDAIHGFLRQKTYFPFEVVVFDDASTDNTSEIITETLYKFQNITYIRAKENCYSRGIDVIQSSLLLCEGDYIAFCEGDDYWIDDFKLQRQFDLLNSRKDYVICLHNAIVEDLVNNIVYYSEPLSHDKEKDAAQIITQGGGRINPTASIFVRKACLDSISKGPVSDHFIMLSAIEHGKAFWFSRPMSVYRYGAHGSFTVLNSGPDYRKTKEFYAYYARGLIETKDRYIARGDVSQEVVNAFNDAIRLNILQSHAAEIRERLTLKSISLPDAVRHGLHVLVAIKTVFDNSPLSLIIDPVIGLIKREKLLRSKKRDLTLLGSRKHLHEFVERLSSYD